MSENAKQKQIVGGVFIGACVALLGHAGATQWMARGLVYNERFLGPELFFDDKIGVKFYAPHKVWVWSQTYWGGRVNELIAQSVGGATASLGLGLFLGLLVALSVKTEVLRTSHGSARWATDEEIDASDMLATPLERYEAAKAAGHPRPDKEACCAVGGKTQDGRHFYLSGKEHIDGSAPTRSGKGIGWVLPTLLSWLGSTIVTDIKGENYQITGWWRSLFSHVIYFNPTDPNSAHWNPMLEIRRGERAIQDAMNLAEILGGQSAANGNEFWDGGAKKFLTATILYVLYTQEDKSLGKCAKLLMTVEQTFEDFAEVTVRDPEDPENEIEQYIKGIASAAAGYSESVRGGWAAGADGALDLWKDPIVARNTATSDFRLIDLQYGKRPVSLFLVVPPPDLKRLSPLVRLFFQQTIDTLTAPELEARENDRHRILMMMDEFPAFGNMGKFESAMAYIAGFDIKAFIIAQGNNQIRGTYGPNEQIISNCHTFLAYRPNDIVNAEELSKMLGKTTGFKEQEGESGKKGVFASLSNRSRSMVEFQRDLMDSGEVSTLDPNRVIIKQAGQSPILGYRVTYYDDPLFVPKYKGKRWKFPKEPLTDFPTLRPEDNPWSGVVDADKNDGDLQTNMLELEAKVVSQDLSTTHDWVKNLAPEDRVGFLNGETPEPMREAKGDASVIDSMTQEIPVGMSAREAALHMTTSSLKRADVNAMLAQAVRAGIVSQEHLDMLRDGPLATSQPLEALASAKQSPRTLNTPELDELDEPFNPFADESSHSEAVVSDYDPFADEPTDPDDVEPNTQSEAALEAPASELDAIFAQMGVAKEDAEPTPQADTHEEDHLAELMNTVHITDMEAHLRKLGADIPLAKEETDS